MTPDASIGSPPRGAPGSPRHALPESLESFQTLLAEVPERVAELGPYGPAYFFLVYVVAECLALPATPLTLSSGYLFGQFLGSIIAVSAGTVAAGIGFTLSRNVLRPQIQELVKDNEDFKNINRAVEREGFKIILLLRLSPLLPFALSNYVYGLSSVGFIEFITATALGFAPGTCAYVYFATTARDAAAGGLGGEWYQYAAGIGVTLVLLKFVSDIAKQAVDDAIEADKAAEAAAQAAAEQAATPALSGLEVFWSPRKEEEPQEPRREAPKEASWLERARQKLGV